jgi:hypothetical protein
MEPYRLPLYRLPVDAEMQRNPVDSGWARGISRGPRTVGEVLAAASAAMDEQDERERQAADPVLWLRAERRKHRLWDRLLGRR